MTIALRITVIEIQDTDSDTVKSTAMMESWLEKYGADGITAVLTTSDNMALGIKASLENAGLTDTIVNAGFDGFKAMAQAVGDGTATFSGAQRPYEIGYQGVMAAVKSLQGGTVENYINPGIDIITADNWENWG